MTAPIALQLYTLRVEIEELGLEMILKSLAEIGYVGVELFNQVDLAQASALCEELGLAIPAIHYVPPPIGEDRQIVMADVALTPAETLIVPWLSPQVYYQSVDGVEQAIDILNESYVAAERAGLRLAYHNHDFEFNTVGRYNAFDTLLANIHPNILFELDVYWAQVGGKDPAALVKQLGERAPLLHIKDGPATGTEAPMVAVGQGAVDIPAVIEAGAEHTEWLIVELDECATDMLTAVRESYNYLVGNKLAQGNKAL